MEGLANTHSAMGGRGGGGGRGIGSVVVLNSGVLG